MTKTSSEVIGAKQSLQSARIRHNRATSDSTNSTPFKGGSRPPSTDALGSCRNGGGVPTAMPDYSRPAGVPSTALYGTAPSLPEDLPSSKEERPLTANETTFSSKKSTDSSKDESQPMLKPKVGNASSLGAADTFLNMEDDLSTTAPDGVQKHRCTQDSRTTSNIVSDGKAGLSFAALVDRLVAQKANSDGRFVATFLCFYRKFAPPTDLILAIVARFEAFGGSEPVQAIRITAQLRCLNIFGQWMTEYPGDFAHSQTRQTMTTFVNGILGNRHFTAAAKEVASQLDLVTEDDDTDWACSDMTRARSNTVESFLSISSTHSAASTLNADSSTEDVCNGSTMTQTTSRHTARHSATSSMSSNTGRSGSQSTGSFQTFVNSVEDAQRYARLLTPSPRFPLTKVHWHQLMEIPEEDIAKELTRMDCIMFSSIKPRDLVRHVGLQPNEKRKYKQLENVTRMINHFNHIALWVANLVLLRDKPKHRAKALERLMTIAWVIIAVPF